MENFIKCTNGVRFRHVPEKLFNSPAFKRTEWVKVEEVELPPIPAPKAQTKKQAKTVITEDASGLLEEFESLPDDNFTNL